jgi:hypothetical protein
MLIRLFNLYGSHTHALNKKICVESFPVTFVADMFLADRCLVIYALDVCRDTSVISASLLSDFYQIWIVSTQFSTLFQRKT